MEGPILGEIRWGRHLGLAVRGMALVALALWAPLRMRAQGPPPPAIFEAWEAGCLAVTPDEGTPCGESPGPAGEAFGAGGGASFVTPYLHLEEGALLTYGLRALPLEPAEPAVELAEAGPEAWVPLEPRPGESPPGGEGEEWFTLDLSAYAGKTVRIRWLWPAPPRAGEASPSLVGISLSGVSPPGPCVRASGPEATLATALDENFAAGIPAAWTVVHGGDCTYPPSSSPGTWTSSNPGSRAAAAPIAAPFAIVDSDWGGAEHGCSMDEALVTPVLNLASAQTVTLRFDHYFHYYTSGTLEVGDVDVRSSKTGGAWVNVRRYQSERPNPESVVADITAQAAGASDAQVRFRYYDARWEYWWMVDNVKVEYTTCPLPGVPSGVSATTGSCNSVTVSWTGGSGATSHNLLRTTGACPSAAGLTTFTGVTSPYEDTAAAAGSSYCYVVQAVNACGTQNSAAVTGTRLAAPAAPAAPSLTPGCTSMGLSWSAVPGASTYDVWRASGASCSGAVKINPSPVAGTTYGDSGLALAAAYSYRVTASNSCGTSPPGTCATASTLACAPDLLFQSAGPWTEVAGNGDANVDPGERWSVAVTLLNAGTLQATGAQAALSANGVEVCNNPGSFGTLPPGGTASYSYIVAVSTTFAQDYGCGSAASFAVAGKICDEASPAGPDEAAAFARAVGRPVLIPYSRTEAGLTGTLTQNATSLFSTVNNPVTSVPDPLQACTVDLVLTPPCGGLGTLTVRVEHDPGADGIYEYSQTVYSGPGTGWANLTGFPLGTLVDGTVSGNGRWRLSVTHVRGLCTPGTLTAWTLHLQGASTAWDCSAVGPGGCVSGPEPVPDGKWVPGDPVRAQRLTPDGTSVRVNWDASACPAPGYALYEGPLSAVATYAYDTWTHCTLGTSGQADVTLAPGDRFFVVVPISGGIEGSHGRTGSGAERPASGVGHCSVTAKEASAGCP